jgi:hypothetical protein
MKREVRYLLLGALLLVSQVLIYYALDWTTMPLGVVIGTAIVYGALCRHYLLATGYGFLSPWTYVVALTLKTSVFPIVRGEDWQPFLTYCLAGSGAGLLMAWWWKRIVRQSEEDWAKAREAAEEEPPDQPATHDA